MLLTKRMAFYAVYNIISKIVFNYRYKNNFEVNFFCLQNTVMQKYSEDACDGAYSVNSLNDSELLDLGSASLSITRYLRIDNTIR